MDSLYWHTDRTVFHKNSEIVSKVAKCGENTDIVV
jgi:hypothetical protein